MKRFFVRAVSGEALAKARELFPDAQIVSPYPNSPRLCVKAHAENADEVRHIRDILSKYEGIDFQK